MANPKREAAAVKRSVYLLRVSTRRQMDTGIDLDPEGNSIPTQRTWCDQKNKELGAVKVDEYVEPGKSGQYMDKRPVFKRLLKRIVEQRDVDYVIIYMRSRIFRNYIEAAIVKQQLQALGVRLISAKENFGDDDMGEAMEAITDVFNWLEVRRNGKDISAKMLNKVEHGGTNGKAKLGYENVTVRIDDRKVNTVTLDEERATYVAMAFELMATGRYANVDQLRDKLTDAGLRMPRTGNPISVQTLWRLLRDKYYVGIVTYKGMEYEGKHPKLVAEDLFYRVQRIMDTHSGSGTRQRTHYHYLRGTVWCYRCKQRFMVQRTKNRHDPDSEYYYFFCGGREDKTCDQPYISVEVMEQAVADHYGDRSAVWLSAESRDRLREAVNAAVTTHHELTDELREEFAKRLAKLDRKESYFLDLAAEEGWPKETLRVKVASIREERASIRLRLDQAERQLDTGRAVFTQALDLLEDPEAIYRQGNETVRTLLNRAFFTKLYVDGRKARVVEHELREPFDTLSEGYKRYQDHGAVTRAYYRRVGFQATNSATHDDVSGAVDDREELISSLSLAFGGQGSSNDLVVELTRLEPVTPTRPVVL